MADHDVQFHLDHHPTGWDNVRRLVLDISHGGWERHSIVVPLSDVERINLVRELLSTYPAERVDDLIRGLSK